MTLDRAILRRLSEIVGPANLLTEAEDLAAYAYDATSRWAQRPEAVVFPTTTDQVAAIVRLAHERRFPVTPRGGGTNVSGGSVPIQGGLVLGLARMNRILELHAENLVAVVEPGVVLMNLNLALAQQGLLFPPDPQSAVGATLGGVVAENAGGPAGLKYGVTKHYVLGLEWVLPDGEVVHLGATTTKNRTGYDLTQLFVGSEGTLGVMTKAILRLIPKPPAARTLAAVFDEVAEAGAVVSKVLAAGILPAKAELLDRWVIQRIEEMMPLGLPTDADALLLFELDGAPEAVDREVERVTAICRASGARNVLVARNADEALRYWTARKAGFAAVFGKARTTLAEDVTVPRSQIPNLIRKCKELERASGITIVIIGHAGDGNLHPSILTDAEDPEHFQRAQELMHAIFNHALALGGVISGEHGVGLEKRPFLALAVSPRVLQVMKDLKRLLDPHGIMNPGKIWE
ncbi:MAG: FAD-binding protein [Verrucomicrobia bacterium]|nr:FAD-binding protein [Verrucomicrobiota bacterium]